MDYKRLGDHIREVNVRNRDLKVTNLLGLSVSKEFMPSIANTIGTDMSAYKIVERGQFVYIADTSRRGDKIAIALLSDYDNAIVILSPLREVTGTYANCIGRTILYTDISVPMILAMEGMNFFSMLSPSKLVTFNSLLRTFTSLI